LQLLKTTYFKIPALGTGF